MAQKITYYAIVTGGASPDRPEGLLRRLEYDDGFEDEGLRSDLTWVRTPLLVEHDNGSTDEDLVEVSHEQASRIVQYFREQSASGG